MSWRAQAKGKCVEVSSVGSIDEVFEHVDAALTKHVPALKVKAGTDAKTAVSSPAATDAIPAAAASLPEGSKIVFVLGGPGSGKGTQCDKILAEYADLGVHHFSAGVPANLGCTPSYPWASTMSGSQGYCNMFAFTECNVSLPQSLPSHLEHYFAAGDLLRDAVKNGNTELEAIMKEGKLVPMETTIGLLKDAMIASGGSTFLIDGFPRALDQAEAFEAGIQPCDTVLFFDCSEEAMRERLLERGKTSGRADDNEETIVKRFHTFVEQSKPVVDVYKTKGKCHDISAMRTPDEVFVDVKAALDICLRHGAPAPAAAAAAEEHAATEPAPAEAKAGAAASLPEGSKIVFVLGGPGSGKGTQCEKIIAHYSNVSHFSAGTLLPLPSSTCACARAQTRQCACVHAASLFFVVTTVVKTAFFVTFPVLCRYELVLPVGRRLAIGRHLWSVVTLHRQIRYEARPFIDH